MTKDELVKIISEKCRVPNTSATELYEIILNRIADKITIGQTARFENVGYFHLRKGKIRKPEIGAHGDKFEYHDFLILSQSSELNINSTDNLVLKVPDIGNQKQDTIDSHFNLSADKPGLKEIENRNSVLQSNSLSTEKKKELLEVVAIIMSEVTFEESINSKNSVLLIDIKKHKNVQSDLNVPSNIGENNSIDSGGNMTFSSEKPKSIKEESENDNSQKTEKIVPKIKEDNNQELESSDKTVSNFEENIWETVSEPDTEKKIELDKIVYENMNNGMSDEVDKLNILYEDFDKTIMGESENLDNKGEKSSGSSDGNVNRKFSRITLKGHSFGKGIKAEKKVNTKISIRERPANLLDETENEKHNKVTGREEQMHNEKFKELSKDEETLSSMSELEEDDYSYDTEIDKDYRSYKIRISRMTFLIIFGSIIVIGGVLYFFLQENGIGNIDKSVILQTDVSVNTTYVDRNFDIPITYPYVQSQSEVQIHGLGTELTSGEIPVEQSRTVESTKNVVVESEKAPKIDEKVQTPTVGAEQVATSIFQYGKTYAVQVAAFRSKQIAENEAAKFTKLGYSSFVEKALVNGKNWFRVRVGNFSSLESAKKFQNSNN